MTVKELIEELKKCNQESEVICNYSGLIVENIFEFDNLVYIDYEI